MLLTDLPLELLNEIIEYCVDSKQVILNVRAVCKRLSLAATRYAFARILLRAPWKESHIRLREMKSRGFLDHVRDLTVKPWILFPTSQEHVNYNSYLLREYLSFCRHRLTRLDIGNKSRNDPELTWDLLETVFARDSCGAGMPFLQELSITVPCPSFIVWLSDGTDDGTNGPAIYPGLEKLELYCFGDRDQTNRYQTKQYEKLGRAVKYLTNGCEKIKSLNIYLESQSGIMITKARFNLPLSASFGNPEALKTLTLDGGRMLISNTAPFIPMLQSFPNLEELRLTKFTFEPPYSGILVWFKDVFIACQGLGNLLKYSFRGSRNIGSPHDFAMQYATFIVQGRAINHVREEDEDKPVFVSMFAVEMEASMHLRATVARRRTDRGLDEDWDDEAENSWMLVKGPVHRWRL